MISPRILFTLLALAVPVISQAVVTITVTSSNGPCYTDSSGTLLADGSIVRVGYFDLSNPATLATLQTSNDFATVNALFTALGEGISGRGSVNQDDNTTSGLVINGAYLQSVNPTGPYGAGHLLGQLTGITPTPSVFPQYTDLSIWVFNSSSTATATEWGIFSAWNTSLTTDGWEFPADLGAQTLKSSEILTVVRGNYDVLNQHMQLSPTSVVPEPGSLLLLLSTCLVLRRRRS